MFNTRVINTYTTEITAMKIPATEIHTGPTYKYSHRFTELA